MFGLITTMVIVSFNFLESHLLRLKSLFNDQSGRKATAQVILHSDRRFSLHKPIDICEDLPSSIPIVPYGNPKHSSENLLSADTRIADSFGPKELGQSLG